MFIFRMRSSPQDKMFAAIRAIDKALLIDRQEHAGVGDVRVAVAGDFSGFGGDGFERLGHGGILSGILGKARGRKVGKEETIWFLKICRLWS